MIYLFYEHFSKKALLDASAQNMQSLILNGALLGGDQQKK